MEALRDLLAATEPYVERAAPHEQLFSGEDMANFERLTAARTKAQQALAALEAEGIGSSSFSHERRSTAFDVASGMRGQSPGLPQTTKRPDIPRG